MRLEEFHLVKQKERCGSALSLPTCLFVCLFVSLFVCLADIGCELAKGYLLELGTEVK